MAKIKFRRDTAAAWTQANPVLAQGEPGFEHDTGLLKIGDGETVWTQLDYASGSGGDSLTDDKAVTVTVGNTDYFAIVNRANNDDAGVESSAVAYDSDNNLITLHISNVNSNELDPASNKLIISKFNSSSNLLWQKQIQEDADPSTAHDVVIDADDNIIVVFNQDNAIDEGDYVNIIKFDSDGNELWKKLYSSSIISDRTFGGFDLIDNTVGSSTFEGNAVQVISVNYNNVPDSNYTWTFEESSNSGTTWTSVATLVGSEYDGFLDRTYFYVSAEDPAITLSFETKIYRLKTQAVNTFMEASGAVTDGTHIYVTGAWNVNSNNELGEITFILKVSNTDGTVEWAQSIRFSEGFPDEAYGMEIDTEGDLVLVGVSYSPAGPNAAYVSKYNGLTGSHIWSRVILDQGEDTSYSGGDITVDSQDNVIVSINSNQRFESEVAPYTTIAHVVKLNSSGTIQWARRAGPGPCASVATGIDSDSLGNVYLSALTTSQKNPVRDSNEFDNTAKDVLAIAKYSTSGAVLWQRYIEADGYTFYQSTGQGTTNDIGEFEENRNSGRNLSLSSDGKIAVQVTVRKRDFDDNTPDSEYWESITFQIDQDGREMTIGSGDEKFAVKASRIPGKLVTLPEVLGGQSYTPTITNLVSDLDVTTPTITYADAELAQHIMKSAPYEYVFGNDGTLTIPNDGDVRLTQTQIGWFSIFGPANNNNDDVWIRANCVDPDTGDVYVVGQEDVNNRGFVARYNSQGEILWSIRLNDLDDENSTRCNAVKLHPSNGNVVVLAEYYGNNTGALMLQIDPDTAQVVEHLGFRDANNNGDAEPYDFDFFSNDDSTDGVVVVGRKYDEWASTPVTPQAGSTTSTLNVLNSELPAGLSTDWYVSGTGITGRTQITNINYYTALTGTTRQGSGAEFTVEVNAGSPGLPVYTYASKFVSASNDRTFYIKPDGTRLYTLVGGTISEFTLSTPWDISTATSTSTADLNLALGIDLLNGLYFKPDGTEFYVFAYDTNGDVRFSKITLTTPWASGSSPTYVEGSLVAVPFAINLEFSDDGTKFYSIYSGQIRQWNLGSAWNITNVDTTPDVSYDFTTVDSIDLRDIAFSADGTSMYATKFPPSGTAYTVVRYQLGTAWDISTAVLTVDSIDIGESVTGIDYLDKANIVFKPDRTKMYIAGQSFSGGWTRIVQFDGASGEAGPATYSVIVTDGGTNYLAGHKVRVLGSALGGTTPENDLIITVDALNVSAISSVSNSGTPNAAAVGPYTAVAHTNYNVGSGADFNVQFNAEGTIIGYGIFNEVGQNYVIGDVITIAGTTFVGGTTPTNDVTITVTSVGGSGDLQNPITVEGTLFPSTQTKISIGDSVDFGGVGSWNFEYPLGGQGFVWTADWNKVVGSTNADANERYFSVAVGSDNAVYAVGEIYTNDSTSNYNAVISKFNSAGTHQWSRALNTYTFGSSAKCVAVRGTTVVVSSFDSNNSETVITKLDTSGNIKWQRITFSGDDSSVAIDTNGDIYAVIEANLENKYESIIKVIRFASNGEPIWRKFIGTLTNEYGGTHEYFKNGRNITLDAEHLYVSGYTTAFADDYESGFLVKLPKAGDCDGYYGGWTVQTEAYDVDKVIGSQAGTFIPDISTGEFESWNPDFGTDWWDPSSDDYYQTLQPIVDRDGGAIEFADGTRQTSSAQQIPQRAIFNGADHRLCLDDMGKHIYVTNSNTRIHVPYHDDNPLPIGFTVVIINNSGGTISIDADGGNLDIVVPGLQSAQYWDLDSPGMATLIKVSEYTWFMTGNVSVD